MGAHYARPLLLVFAAVLSRCVDADWGQGGWMAANPISLQFSYRGTPLIKSIWNHRGHPVSKKTRQHKDSAKTRQQKDSKKTRQPKDRTKTRQNKDRKKTRHQKGSKTTHHSHNAPPPRRPLTPPPSKEPRWAPPPRTPLRAPLPVGSAEPKQRGKSKRKGHGRPAKSPRPHGNTPTRTSCREGQVLVPDGTCRAGFNVTYCKYISPTLFIPSHYLYFGRFKLFRLPEFRDSVQPEKNEIAWNGSCEYILDSKCNIVLAGLTCNACCFLSPLPLVIQTTCFDAFTNQCTYTLSRFTGNCGVPPADYIHRTNCNVCVL